MQQAADMDIIRHLQKEVLSLQGFKKQESSQCIDMGLAGLEKAFPQRSFPTGAVHEFLSYIPQDAAATNGFIAAILGRVMLQGAACLWIGPRRTIFPPALRLFGMEPDRILFADISRPKDALWAVEEALKCDSLAAVVGELSELSFTESRRLQLAVEESRVTGFIHRFRPKAENTVACVTRWKISPLPSEAYEGLPGVGMPRWMIQLLKVRNGRPGRWQMEWAGGKFRQIEWPMRSIAPNRIFKTG